MKLEEIELQVGKRVRNFYIVRGPKVEEISRSHQDKDKGKREGVELQKHSVLQFIGSLGQWKYGL